MPSSRPFDDFIQIAGVRDRAEADMLIACGVRYLGFPLRLPVNDEDLTEAAAADIIRALPAGTWGVLITYLDEAADLAALAQALGASMVQVHGEISSTELRILRRMRPGLLIVKSLVVGELSQSQLEDRLEQLGPWVDAFITDTFDPATGASGATGRTHDWRISRELAAMSPKPVILAGGLNPGNVAQAIAEVMPAGVDVHTGVEDAAGRKDPAKVRAFLDAAHAALGRLRSVNDGGPHA